MDGKIGAYMPLFALIITVLLIAVTAVLAFTGKMIPDEIKTGDGLAFAWFFISSAQRGTSPPNDGKETEHAA
jgi:hypothetical protein